MEPKHKMKNANMIVLVIIFSRFAFVFSNFFTYYKSQMQSLFIAVLILKRSFQLFCEYYLIREVIIYVINNQSILLISTNLFNFLFIYSEKHPKQWITSCQNFSS
jgi:hypothetical protein